MYEQMSRTSFCMLGDLFLLLILDENVFGQILKPFFPYFFNFPFRFKIWLYHCSFWLLFDLFINYHPGIMVLNKVREHLSFFKFFKEIVFCACYSRGRLQYPCIV